MSVEQYNMATSLKETGDSPPVPFLADLEQEIHARSQGDRNTPDNPSGTGPDKIGIGRSSGIGHGPAQLFDGVNEAGRRQHMVARIEIDTHVYPFDGERRHALQSPAVCGLTRSVRTDHCYSYIW